MTSGERRVPLAAALLLLLHVAPVGAQSSATAPAGASAVPVQGLSFGMLLPGVPDQISVQDGARRAEFLLVGTGDVDVSFILPPALVGERGGQIPLRFGPRDAALLLGGSEVPSPVNPLAVTRVQLTSSRGTTRLVVGARVSPPRDLPVGRYGATIVVLLAKPGT